MNFSTTESTEHTENGESTLTGKIIGAAIDVHRGLEPGLLESAYEACFVYELTRCASFPDGKLHMINGRSAAQTVKAHSLYSS